MTLTAKATSDATKTPTAMTMTIPLMTELLKSECVDEKWLVGDFEHAMVRLQGIRPAS